MERSSSFIARGFSEIGATQDQENRWLSTVAPELIVLPSGFVREIQENENFLIELESLEEDYKFYLTKENDEIKALNAIHKAFFNYS